MNIANKNILISGASDGIGRSIALCLAKHNVNLVLLGRNQAKLDEVKSLCNTNGSSAVAYAFDLTDKASFDIAIQSIKEKCSIDIIVNNAGIWHKSTPLGQLEPETIEAIINTNLTAQMLLTRQFVEGMKERETAIINIISSAGMQGKAGRTAYAASKYGMRGFTEALRDETHANQIRIGAIFQGGISTQMFAKADEAMPIEKYTNPDDLADVVLFMLTRPAKLWLSEVQITY